MKELYRFRQFLTEDEDKKGSFRNRFSTGNASDVDNDFETYYERWEDEFVEGMAFNFDDEDEWGDYKGGKVASHTWEIGYEEEDDHYAPIINNMLNYLEKNKTYSYKNDDGINVKFEIYNPGTIDMEVYYSADDIEKYKNKFNDDERPDFSYDNLLKEEEIDVLGNEFLQDIQGEMKRMYSMDVDMDDIKDWVQMYYIGYNSEYDEGPGDVDYEGNEFGSEDFESEKKELVFDTGEREDFYTYIEDYLEEGKLNENSNSNNFDLKKYLAEGKLFEEDYSKESLLKALGDADDAFIQLGNGRELIIFNPNFSDDGSVDMWGDDTVFAVDKDGQEEEIDYRDIAGINLDEGKLNEENKNDYANSEEDYTDEMVVEKIKDIIKYHELDPQDLIDEIRIEFGVDAMD